MAGLILFSYSIIQSFDLNVKYSVTLWLISLTVVSVAIIHPNQYSVMINGYSALQCNIYSYSAKYIRPTNHLAYLFYFRLNDYSVSWLIFYSIYSMSYSVFIQCRLFLIGILSKCWQPHHSLDFIRSIFNLFIHFISVAYFIRYLMIIRSHSFIRWCIHSFRSFIHSLHSFIRSFHSSFSFYDSFIHYSFVIHFDTFIHSPFIHSCSFHFFHFPDFRCPFDHFIRPASFYHSFYSPGCILCILHSTIFLSSHSSAPSTISPLGRFRSFCSWSAISPGYTVLSWV